MDIAGSIHLLESTGWDLEVRIFSNNNNEEKENDSANFLNLYRQQFI